MRHGSGHDSLLYITVSFIYARDGNTSNLTVLIQSSSYRRLHIITLVNKLSFLDPKYFLLITHCGPIKPHQSLSDK